MDPKSILLSKTLWANVIAFIAALLGAHKIVVDPDTQATFVAAIMAVLNIGLRLVTKQPVTLTGASPVFAMLLAAAALTACTSTGGLTSTGKTVATIGCAIDGIAQPIGLQFVNGIPTVGGIAATVDQAIVHPLVQKACGDLAASIGTSPASAKPVAMPTS